MNLVDVILIVLALGYGVAGFRGGALAGVLGLVGLCLGAYFGAQVIRALAQGHVHGSARAPVLVVGTVVCAVALQAVGSMAGAALRRRLQIRSARMVDSVVGAVVSAVGLLFVAWLIALPLAAAPYPSLSAELRDSQVLRITDDALPDSARQLSDSLRRFLDDSGFPQVFDPLQRSDIVDAAPPNGSLAASPAVAAVRASVLKVRGDAPSCGSQIEGSGFVYSPGRVMTNAHVVAGTSRVAVESGGRSLRGQVVLFDPDRDVAVIAVPGLTAEPLGFASTPAAAGADAIVLGYPQDGPFDAQPARVRTVSDFDGLNIYGTKSAERQVYQVRATVRSGNSGGPLISPSGEVLGLVFARALDSSDTGYALTAAEVRKSATDGASATAAVGTGPCS